MGVADKPRLTTVVLTTAGDVVEGLAMVDGVVAVTSERVVE